MLYYFEIYNINITYTHKNVYQQCLLDPIGYRVV